MRVTDQTWSGEMLKYSGIHSRVQILWLATGTNLKLKLKQSGNVETACKMKNGLEELAVDQPYPWMNDKATWLQYTLAFRPGSRYFAGLFLCHCM